MSYCNRRGFNLIEVTLALGVVGIGMVSILALFPVGFNASRDAAVESSASRAAEQLLHQMQGAVRSPGGWQALIVNAGAGNNAFVAAAYPDGTGPAPNVPADLIVQFDHTSATYATPFEVLPPGSLGRLYRYVYTGGAPPPPNTDGLYKAISFIDRNANGLYDPGEPIEFEGLIFLWVSPVDSIPIGYAARLNAEITWPAQAPYTARQRALYTLDLYNK